MRSCLSGRSYTKRRRLARFAFAPEASVWAILPRSRLAPCGPWDRDEDFEPTMRHLPVILLVLCLYAALLAGCASYNEEHGLQCAPAYAPGTAAYRASLLRN